MCIGGVGVVVIGRVNASRAEVVGGSTVVIVDGDDGEAKIGRLRCWLVVAEVWFVLDVVVGVGWWWLRWLVVAKVDGGG